MKKIMAALAFAALLSAPGIQAEELFFLTKVTTASNVETSTFKYNGLDKPSQILVEDFGEPQMSTNRFLTYAENGNCIEEIVHQDYYQTGNPDEYIVVAKVTYDYDDQNRLSKRTTFGLDLSSAARPEDCPLKEQSYMEFSYDFWGCLSNVVTSFPGGGTVQRDDYMYDSDDVLLRKDSYYTYNGANDLLSSLRYEYDEDGNLATVTNMAYDDQMVLEVKNLTDYIYSPEGTLESIESYMGERSVLTSREEMVYGDELVIQPTVYPVNFEDTFWGNAPSLYELVNRPLKSRDLYIINDVTDKVEFVDTYYYTYSTDGSGVRMVADNFIAPAILVKNLGDNRIVLDGVAPAAPVSILDMTGRVCYQGLYNGSINVAALPAGGYIVKTDNATAKFVK